MSDSPETKAARTLGKLGAAKGGKAAAASMSKRKRKRRAQAAARARWAKWRAQQAAYQSSAGVAIKP